MRTNQKPKVDYPKVVGKVLHDILYAGYGVPERISKIFRFELGKHKGYTKPTETIDLEKKREQQ